MLETVSLYFSQVTHPCFHLLYTYFLSECCQEYLVYLCRPCEIFCLAFLLAGMDCCLGGGDPWISTIFLGPFFPSWPYPMGCCQADTWRSQSLFSSAPVLWSCFLPCFLLSRCSAPPSHGHCNQGSIQPSHYLGCNQSTSFTNDVCINPIKKGRYAFCCLKETVKVERSPPQNPPLTLQNPLFQFCCNFHRAV